MSFSPLPLVAWCHMRASRAAGFLVVLVARVAMSILPAPSRNSSILIPCSAMGTRPTVAMSDVRPPTQSHMGKRLSQPPSTATLSSFDPSPVMATACLAKSRFLSRKACWVSIMPLRGSGVEPDLEMTSTSVDLSFEPRWSRTRRMPSGSVLSRKCILSLSRRTPSASATSSGPRADPPMPMESTSVKRAAEGGVISLAWTARANAFTSPMVRAISLVSSSVGARCGARSQ